MEQHNGAAICAFPVEGPALISNSPGTVVPSHGTSKLGQKWAIDICPLVEDMSLSRAPTAQLILAAVKTINCGGWGSDVYCAADGRVVSVKNDFVDPKYINLISRYIRTKYLSRLLKKSPHQLVGNNVVIDHGSCFSLYSHLRYQSACVSEQALVAKGQKIGEIGCTGNSSFPHLHFQIMNAADLNVANGRPIVFDEYELRHTGGWEQRAQDIPKNGEIVRRPYENTFMAGKVGDHHG